VTENFLHYLWENLLFNKSDLLTDDGKFIEVIHPGTYNTNSGPDFFNAQLKIDGTSWAGNVEIHIHSSDWYKHNHQRDPVYDSVVLHVVYLNDVPTKRIDGSLIPTTELKGHFPEQLWDNFISLVSQNKWISCIDTISSVKTDEWSQLFLDKAEERMRLRTQQILISLNGLKGDWEECFYQYLAKNFGFQLNAMPFEMVARSLPLKIIQKEITVEENINALLFGQAGMLKRDFIDGYPQELRSRYEFLQHKYSLKPLDYSYWKFLRMRPVNFPTIRIAQFSAFIAKHKNLFGMARDMNSKKEMYTHFECDLNPYWDDHFLFDKPSKTRKKIIGRTSIDNLLINTHIPFQFAWGMYAGDHQFKDNAIKMLASIAPEMNRIIEKWDDLGVSVENAVHSQALIQLKQYHCDEKKCLTCSIGSKLINSPQYQ
jgi:hypothetical protein